MRVLLHLGHVGGRDPALDSWLDTCLVVEPVGLLTAYLDCLRMRRVRGLVQITETRLRWGNIEAVCVWGFRHLA